MRSNKPKLSPVDVWWEPAQHHLQVYLIEGERVGLIDTAAPGTDLAGALARAGRRLDEIQVVLNTHGHLDHVAMNGVVKQASGAQICIHEDDKAFVEDPARCFDHFWAPLSGALRDGEVPAETKATFLSAMGPAVYAAILNPVVAVDKPLADGEILSFGDSLRLRVVHLPGHSPGSVGYYWEEEGVLITGDSVSAAGLPDGSLPLIFDLAAYRRSVDRLLELPISRLYTCHPYRGVALPPAQLREGADVRTFFENCRDVAAALAEALSAQSGTLGPRILTEVADEVIATLPPEMGFKRLSDQVMVEFTLDTVLHGLAAYGGSARVASAR